jgi:hypothetical protein
MCPRHCDDDNDGDDQDHNFDQFDVDVNFGH